MRFQSLKKHLILAGLILTSMRGAEPGGGSFTFSLVLSGHVLLGIGYEYALDEHHAFRVTAYPLLVPGKGFPYAFRAGYRYSFAGDKWQPRLGLDFALLVSPPVKGARRHLPMLVLTPGLTYQDSRRVNWEFSPWVAYFLTKTRRRIAPIGLELEVNQGGR